MCRHVTGVTSNLYTHAPSTNPPTTHNARGLSSGITILSSLAPVTAACTLAANAMGVANASNAPRGCVMNASHGCRCAECANAVVMPQVMQGRPNITIHPQGGRPSCRCVPVPEGFGSSHAASMRTVRQHAAMTPAMNRPCDVSREETCGGLEVAGWSISAQRSRERGERA